MNYRRLSNEELRKQTYPNLMAEWIESGYSFCTLGKCLGLGRYRNEGDSEVLAKMTGKDKITAQEAFELSGLFGVKTDYLFSHELKCIDEKPMAYWRWYESNQKKEEELQQLKTMEHITRKMREKPYLLKVFKALAEMPQDEFEKLAGGQCEVGGVA